MSTWRPRTCPRGTGLYEGGSSLHDVWTNVDEHVRSIDETVTAEGAQQRHVAEMSSGVQALLKKYTQPSPEAVGATSSADLASGGDMGGDGARGIVEAGDAA